MNRRSETSGFVLSLTATAACLALIGYKLFLTTRINVNWDEFYYLNFVYAAIRGELNIVLQGAYTHLFRWLPMVRGDEMDQIVAARLAMMLLLALTVFLIWRLARRWLDRFPALVPSFVYLSALPVMVHGGSFRSDSMLAPLLMGSLCLVVAPSRTPDARWHRDLLAGALLGAAFAISIKIVLFAPLVFALLMTRGQTAESVTSNAWRLRLRGAVFVAAGAGLAAATVIYLHWLTVDMSNAEGIAAHGARAARKTLLDTPWFPRLDYWVRYADWQPLYWILIGSGAIMALVRRRLDLASLSLALLPLAFYRNAFPYFYVVMLAPLTVLAGFAIQEIDSYLSMRIRPALGTAAATLIWIGLLYQGGAYLGPLRDDNQAVQRAIVSGVHEIFPEPVSYVDRCGMISSFRKVNFFMSTWGMDNYRRAGTPFMPRAIETERPAFVLTNHWALSPYNRIKSGLLSEDHELIARFYPRYWGPVRVAGGAVQLEEGSIGAIEVPFAADYRLESNEPVLIDGVLHESGDVIPIDRSVMVRLAENADSAKVTVKLFLASARPSPGPEPDPARIFMGL